VPHPPEISFFFTWCKVKQLHSKMNLLTLLDSMMKNAIYVALYKVKKINMLSHTSVRETSWGEKIIPYVHWYYRDHQGRRSLSSSHTPITTMIYRAIQSSLI